MSIKMPLKFVGSYKVITRQGGAEKQEFCQKLTMAPLAPHEQGAAGKENSTHAPDNILLLWLQESPGRQDKGEPGRQSGFSGR